MGDETISPSLLAFRGVSKRFGGTLAVDDVSLAFNRGEIVALLGENGAGKSTLIKMLAGIHVPDAGSIEVKGAAYAHRPAGGARQAVAFVHQDLGLVEWMSVAENVAMAQGFPRRLGLIDWPAAERAATAALAAVGFTIDPSTRVARLSRTEKSLLAIARAVAVRPEVLVLDEPTASLPADEVQRLFAVLRELRADGVGMIYVSHRLDEIFAIADRVAVLRDGRLVATREVSATDPAELVELIIGGRVRAHVRGRADPDAPAALEVAGLRTDAAGPVDLVVRRGEIVGLVGLRGAGQNAIGRALFGAVPRRGGSIGLRGRTPGLEDPAAALAAGIGFVAGERVEESLGGGLSVRENLFLNPAAAGRRLLTVRRPADERAAAKRATLRFGVRPDDPERPIETLSGGNQQKVVLARWLGIGCAVLVLEEPTAGVDVGAKAEIYRLLESAREAGTAMLVVSTDFEEVAAICDRALVFSRGLVVAALAGDAVTPEGLLHAASAGEHAREAA